ncbi:ABC transporter substrate-binding protein [soil metagenome]
MRPVRSVVGAVVVAVGLVLLGSCGGDTTSGTGAADPPPPPEGDGSFPVTVENCGTQITFDEVPGRVVTMNQHVTELLLALGLEDRMIGTAFLDSTIRPDLADAYEAVPVLADEYPTREQVLAVDPDLVVGGFASAFDDTAAGSRPSLQDAGIGSYLTSGYCPDLVGPQTLDLLEQDIANLGAAFGVPGRAAELIEAVRAPITDTADALEGIEPIEVFVYDSGTDAALTAAGFENTTRLIELAGGRNVFADVEENFTEVSWEDVVVRDPDAIVILDYGSEAAEDKVASLRTHPVASTLRAVREERFVVVELADVVPGIGNGDAVAAMAEGFHPGRR